GIRGFHVTGVQTCALSDLRTAGFNSVDIGDLYPSSWLLSDVLMFIGGGSAGTAGGIKVTTLGLLLFVIWAELRGEPKVNVRHRRSEERRVGKESSGRWAAG